MTQDQPNRDHSSWPGAHPDFDGHLEKPVHEMTDAERLRWIWEGTLLLHWARHRVKLHPPTGQPSATPRDANGESSPHVGGEHSQ